MTMPIPVKVDAQTDVRVSDSCNCSCPPSCCFSLRTKKHRHRNSCEIKVNNVVLAIPTTPEERAKADLINAGVMHPTPIAKFPI